MNILGDSIDHGIGLEHNGYLKTENEQQKRWVLADVGGKGTNINKQQLLHMHSLQTKDGFDYHFLSMENFQQRVSNNEFYEYANVHNKYYGTLKNEIQGKLSDNIDLLLNIDVQGTLSIKDAAKNDEMLAKQLITVFVMPPTLDELEARLVNRGTDSREEIDRRLKTALNEMEYWSHYDYCIHSKDKETDLQNLTAIYKAEKQKVLPKIPLK